MSQITEQDRENLVAYLDGELDELTAREIETRISLDADVRAELETLKQAWELLDHLPKSEASSNFTHRTLDRVLEHRPISTMHMPKRVGMGKVVRGVAWAMVVVLVLLVGFGVGRNVGKPKPKPTPEAKIEETLIRDLRVIKHKTVYEAIDDVEFLKKLDQPELFGKEKIE
ncbi:MAG: anti-sigma factor family protein [Gemmataceae bacterium]